MKQLSRNERKAICHEMALQDMRDYYKRTTGDWRNRPEKPIPEPIKPVITPQLKKVEKPKVSGVSL